MADKKYSEYHPFRHSWYKQTDYVTVRNSRGRAIEVKRIEECEHCPVEKVTLIDTNVWEDWHVVRKPYYRRPKGTVVVRGSRQAFLRDNFLKTTSLTKAELGMK